MFRVKLVLILFLIAKSSFAGDFRNVNWGASQKQVKASEKKKPAKEDADMLGYIDSLAGIKVFILYKFTNHKLVSGIYSNGSTHVNLTDYVDDYLKINELIKKKYGDPTKEETNWKDEFYKDDPPHWGIAIAMGQLEYFTGWKNDRSYISNVLNGDNFKITHMIIYNEKNYFEKNAKDNEDKTLDKL